MAATTTATPDCLGGSGPEVERLEPVGQILGQRGPAKGTGKHSDERDADLNAGKKAGLNIEQAHRSLGTGGALLGHGGETRSTGGDERKLGHGEKAVEDDQEGNDAEFEGEHGGSREGLEEGLPLCRRPHGTLTAEVAQAR
jgi:hypothetical protein